MRSFFQKRKDVLRLTLLGFVFLFSFALLSGVSSLSAFAQGGKADKGTTKKHEPGDAVAKKKETKIKKRQGGSLFVLEDIEIEGKVYKPQAFHVINRKELNLEWDVGDSRFRSSFLSEVVSSIDSDVF